MQYDTRRRWGFFAKRAAAWTLRGGFLADHEEPDAELRDTIRHDIWIIRGFRPQPGKEPFSPGAQSDTGTFHQHGAGRLPQIPCSTARCRLWGWAGRQYCDSRGIRHVL